MSETDIMNQSTANAEIYRERVLSGLSVPDALPTPSSATDIGYEVPSTTNAGYEVPGVPEVPYGAPSGSSYPSEPGAGSREVPWDIWYSPESVPLPQTPAPEETNWAIVLMFILIVFVAIFAGVYAYYRRNLAARRPEPSE